MELLLFKLIKVIGVLLIIFLISFHLHNAIKDKRKNKTDKCLIVIIFGGIIAGCVYFLIFDLLYKMIAFVPTYLNLPAKYVLIDVLGILLLTLGGLISFTDNRDKKELYSKILSIVIILLVLLFVYSLFT